MGTAILQTSTNAAQNINSAQRTIGTYTNSTGNVQNVHVFVYVLEPGSTDGSATYTLTFTRSGLTTYLRKYDAAGASTATGLLVAPQTTLDGLSDSSFTKTQLRPGETLTVAIQSDSASDSSVAVDCYFVDADAVVGETESASATGVSLASAGYGKDSTISTEDRVIVPRMDLSSFGGASFNALTLTIKVISDEDNTDAVTEVPFWSTGDEPDTQTTFIVDYGSYPLLKAAPFLVPAGHYMQIILQATGASISAVNITYYFDVMETPRQSSGAPFIFIDDDQ